MRRLKVRRGISEVIASIILTAVVLTVGGAIWSFAQSATLAATNDYINGTFTTMKDITERFIVEHVSKNTDGTQLYVWVYNYGTVDIVSDVYANATHYNPTTHSYTYTCKLTMGTTPIVSGSYPQVTIDFQSNSLQSGDKIGIKVYTRRQNIAYYTYYVP
jgi:flagellin-like protein